MVAKGFHYKEGIDFLDTFSPMVQPTTIHIVLFVATIHHWPILEFDINNSFLYRHLKQPVYLVQSSSFESVIEPNSVCELRQALYGLKQAPRAWFDRFSDFLLDFGFACSSHDSSLFIYQRSSETI